MFRWLAPLALAASPVCALDARTEQYVEANLLAVLYHEIGHALIDVMDLPIFGQEEDAADVLSVLMVHDLFEAEAATRILYDTALGFLVEDEMRNRHGADIEYWDVHGPDLQRYYTAVCLFYGADPEARSDLAEELGLPQERAEGCADEYELANASWGPVLDRLQERTAPGRFVFRRGAAEDFAADILRTEIVALNEDFTLPGDVVIRLDSCGEVNAFYDSELREILVCSELASFLAHTVPGS